MIRGSTASFRFKLPRHFSEFECIRVTFWQNENAGPSLSRPLPIVKVKDECIPCNTSNQFKVILYAEETLRFVNTRKAFVQFQGVSHDGITYASKPREFRVYPNVNEDILTPETFVVDEQNIEM